MNQDRHFKEPILYLFFNRLDVIKETFPIIKEKKPLNLYLAADGPRSNKPGEGSRCEECRNWILDQIDWDCNLNTLFRSENLGCKRSVSGAITWFFDHVERGIILEDDCLPDPTFFEYCTRLLDKYKGDEQIMHISGCNLGIDLHKEESYVFSIFSLVWGWATWKSSWEHMDLNISQKNSFEEVTEKVMDFLDNEKDIYFWKQGFEGAESQDSWAFPWTFSIWMNNGLTIIPTKNLIKNIGFGENATHTVTSDFRSNLALESMDSLTYNSSKSVNQDFINIRAKKLFGIEGTLMGRMNTRLKSVINQVKKKR